MADMSAEHGPNPGFQPELGRTLQPAAEGPSFAQSNQDPEIPNQYDARLGGQRTAGRRPAPGVPPVPGRYPGPESHNLRNLLIASGAATTAALIAVGTFLGIDRLRSSNGDDQDISPSGSVTQVDQARESVTSNPTVANTPEATVEPEVIPFEIGVEHDYGNFSLIVEEGRMDSKNVEFSLANGVKVEKQLHGIEDWTVSEEGRGVMNNFVDNIQYRNWMKRNNLDPEAVTFEQYKAAKANGDQKVNGIEIPKKTVSFALMSEPPEVSQRIEGGTDASWGIIRTPKRDIIVIFTSYIHEEDTANRIVLSENQMLISGSLYAMDVLGKPGFYRPDQRIFDESIKTQFEIAEDVFGEFDLNEVSFVNVDATP